jgi:hypothetical protein
MTLNEREGLKQEVKDRLEELLALADQYGLVIDVNNVPTDKQYQRCEVLDRTVQ